MIFILLTGCTSQKVSDLDIIWHDGECLLVADGLSAEQAEQLGREWSFKACEVTVDEAAEN